MTKRAFLFAGQGAQKLGMASDLYAAYPVVKETFDTASRILGYDLRELIDSNEEKLNQTRYTQPAILTTSVAIYRLLAENVITPDKTFPGPISITSSTPNSWIVAIES